MGRWGGVVVCWVLMAAGARGGEIVVRPGDTLSEIAWRELGASARWTEIAHANGLSNATSIYPGQVLRLPGDALIDAQPTMAYHAENAPWIDGLIFWPPGRALPWGVKALAVLAQALVLLAIMTLLIRVACWFSLVPCSTRQALALAVIAMALSAACMALLTAAGPEATFRFIAVSLGVMALAVAASVFFVKGVLQCPWRSVITIGVMQSFLVFSAYALGTAAVFGFLAARLS